ncbi:hypothetical protein M3Y98_00463500 [Aphelenchoides besseyi]|nr:hypothetical protein M3Y98_00463500 [Aphelenchoides besseyi]
MVADSRATLFFTLIVSALAQNSTTVAPAISLPVPPLVLYIVCGVCSFGAIVSCVFFVLACTVRKIKRNHRIWIRKCSEHDPFDHLFCSLSLQRFLPVHFYFSSCHKSELKQ